MPRLVVGLTGGIGTGKSAALEAFQGLGAATVSLDRMAHDLSRKGGVVYRGIVRAFGRRYLRRDGELDRRALAQAVFSNTALRRRLERATHPELLRRMRRQVSRSRRPVTVADVPLLFEAGLQGCFDLTMLVSAPESLALRRVMRRDGMSRLEALRRMRAQMPLSRKEALADVVVRNEGSSRDLRKRVGEYYRAFELMARGKA